MKQKTLHGREPRLAAKKEELEVFAEMNVYEHIKKEEVRWTAETVFVGTRCVATGEEPSGGTRIRT
eukprot:738073-Amphidinium_carterae.1